jgi:type I restriction enzyme S subunit
LPAGTVCITIAANIADSAILDYPACFPDSVVGFVADQAKTVPEFVKWSIEFVSSGLDAMAPATAQKNINLAILDEIKLPCPALPEQREAVRRATVLLEAAESLSVHFVRVQEVATGLTRSSLAKTYRGELVPQNPNDEPASALLDRLRVESAKAAEADAEVAKPSKRKSRLAPRQKRAS